MTIDVAEMVDEFVWLLEDTADFIAGRVMAAIRRYHSQLLPPYARVLAEYSQAARALLGGAGPPGRRRLHQAPAGRVFFDFLGENTFRTDMGIERGVLGSLLEHTGPVAESEAYAARVFGAHRSYSGLAGTSGLQPRHHAGLHVGGRPGRACDRNCHKSIEQGLMLTGGGRFPGADPQPLRHHRADPPARVGPRDDPRKGDGGSADAKIRGPEGGLCRPHQLHL